jgi:ABC-2 type transport system ATP-binding protein
MTNIFDLQNVTKQFGKTTALQNATMSASERSIIGLVGKNGSGKTTLLRHITGLYLPTSGECSTFGVPTAKLGAGEYSRIGAVQQDDAFLPWMRITEFLGYISHFYERWDKNLQNKLVRTLELDESKRVGTLSPGTKQKLALIAACCHHPELLLLDEPLSDLDPIARQDVLTSLLDQFRNDEVTIVISSHMLPEVERIADRIVLLDQGQVIVDANLDELKEQYAEWVVTSVDGSLPRHYREDFILSSEGDAHRARLFVSDAPGRSAQFGNSYNAQVESRPVNLDKLFGILTPKKTHSETVSGESVVREEMAGRV